MAYRKTSRKSYARGRTTRTRPVARRSTSVRRGRSNARGSGSQVVRIVIQHEAATASSPGGLENPQVQTQTKKGKF